MMPMKRTNEPEILKKNKKAWTKHFVQTGKWRTDWYGNHKLFTDELKLLTNNHCAFCDDILKPFGSAKTEIEHFKPKSKYKCHAYIWLNLFPICDSCNKSKLSKFDDLILRPDYLAFTFEKWFYFNTKTYEIYPKKLGNADWKRAEKTIEIYNLNSDDLIERRKFILAKQDNLEKNEKAFRYY